MDQILENSLSKNEKIPAEELQNLKGSMSSVVVPGTVEEPSDKMNSLTILVCSTGSVATIKLPVLVTQLHGTLNKVKLQVVLTEKAKHFCSQSDLKTSPIDNVYTDSEWETWKHCENGITNSLHDDLSKRANILLIAPLDANSLAKIANGLCDNLLTSIVRVWDFNNKIAICCPAMNTQMWVHPITDLHIKQIQSLGFIVIPPIAKKLMCGDIGIGAMAEPSDIVSTVKRYAQFDGKKMLCDGNFVRIETDTTVNVASK